MKDFITLIMTDMNITLLKHPEPEVSHVIGEILASIHKDTILWHVVNKNAKHMMASKSEHISKVGNKWETISGLMKGGFMKNTVYNGSVYMELSSKNKWIVFPDNSALYVRSNLGGKVVVNAFIPNIYNEAEAAGILYNAQESTAYSLIKKIVKKVEQIRLHGIIDNLEEDEV